jgi:putative FmdB family regulatory protein
VPTYCYKCFSCKHYEEIHQKMNDEPVSICPVCGAANFKRIITNVSIIFKGPGFHVTDYSGSKKALSTSPSAEKEQKSETSSKSDKVEKSDTGAAGASSNKKDD